MSTNAPRPEPRRMTTADLAALVVGVALASSLDWYSAWVPAQQLGPRAAPPWYVALMYAAEALQMGCLALLPVVLTRRVRHGGPIRPAEFAALAVAFPRLLLGIERLPALGFLYVAGGERRLVEGWPYRDWMRTLLLLAALAAVLAVAERRRFAPWVNGLLALAAWYGLTFPVQFFAQRALNPVLEAWFGPPALVRLAGTTLLQIPFLAILYAPAAAALVDLRRRGPRGRTWVEWAGVALVLSWWSAAEIRNGAGTLLDPFGQRFATWLAFEIATQAASLGLAAALALRFGPAFGRWLDPRSPDEPTG